MIRDGENAHRQQQQYKNTTDKKLLAQIDNNYEKTITSGLGVRIDRIWSISVPLSILLIGQILVSILESINTV